jgi:biopolymer transport protein ExbB
LEQRLGVLSTIGQIAPLLGLLGAVLGFMETGEEVITDHHAHFAKSLMPLALGLAIGVPCYVGYNHLVAVIGTIIIDMQKAGLRALRMVGELKGSVRRGRKKVKLEALDNSVEFGEEEKK